MRNPSTPDCAIKGCTYAAARLGMCQKHARIAGMEFTRKAMIDSMIASHNAARKVWRSAQAYVRKEIARGAA